MIVKMLKKEKNVYYFSSTHATMLAYETCIIIGSKILTDLLLKCEKNIKNIHA